MDTLYALPAEQHFRSLKVALTAAFSKHSLKVLSQPPEFVFGETNKSAEFLAKFPLGKVPAFEGSDGTTLSESNAISYYVANEQLRGKTLKDQALVQQWVNFADNEVLPSACTWVYPTMGMTQFNKADCDAAKEQLKKCLNVLNVYLTSRTYLVGERISLADVVLCCNLRMLFTDVMDAAFREPYPNVTRWFMTLVNQPQFLQLVKETKLCQKEAQPDAKKYAELHKKGGNKNEAKKKDEKKKPAHEEPQDVPQEKEEDPLAKAPKGTFDFDAFKRCFSNEDTETKALPHLWANFDKENYSIYRAVYKYPEDLTLKFMTSNLANGMLQRIEKLRKHAMGIIYVLGEPVAKKHNIEALWIFRGQEVAFQLNDSWNVDAPSYAFTKMDVSKQEDKDLVESYIMAKKMGSYAFPEEDKILDYMCFK